MKTLHVSIIATLTILLLAATCISNVFGQNQNAEQTVHIIIPDGALNPRCSPLCFVPEDVTVARGTVVDWINKDLVAHSITSGKPSDNQTGTVFDSGLIPPGHDFEYRFDRTGDYSYFDIVHPWATGIIRVSDNTHSNTIPLVITARTDRDSYYDGDEITVTGAANGYTQDSDVIITIKDPNKNTVMTDHVPLQQDSNSYLAKITADRNFTESGTYEVDAKYGTAQYQTYFDFYTASPEKILQINLVGNSLEPELVQGQSAQMNIVFNLDKNYTVQYMELSLTGMPQGIQAWINPQLLHINKNYTQYAQIPVYVNSGTAPGNYTINVIGNGNVLNGTSNKEISFNYQRIGSINLAIKPASSPISVDIGQPDSTSTQFCTDTDTSGHMCESFVGYQEFPVTVHSDRSTRVRLDAQVPSGGYLKFIPDSLDVTGNGSSSRMMIAGIMEPFMINPLDTRPMTIKATSADGSTALAYLPIIQPDNVTVLKSPAPIGPVSNQLVTSGSQATIISFGAVYEPQAGADSTLPVKLQALGIVNGSDIVPFTPSFSVKIPQDSFVLNSSEPYYFMVEPVSHSLPSGSITFAVGQEIGRQHFVQNVTLDVSNEHFGGSLHPSSASQIDLQSTGPNSQNTGSNPLVTTIEIGGIVGAGAGAISFFVLRRKPT